MRNPVAARRAEQVQPVRNWNTFAVPNGQVVYRGRYYFAWSRGHFVGAYDTLDDAVEALMFRNKKTHGTGGPEDRCNNSPCHSSRKVAVLTALTEAGKPFSFLHVSYVAL